jgi:group I intron endonuclease
MYVGSAITGKIGNRFHKHLFGLSGSVPVRSAIAKYGLDNFAFILLDTVEGETSRETNGDLLKLEDQYISLMGPAYNIAPRAGNSFGYKHTQRTKASMRENYSPERREAVGSLNRGNTLSPRTIARLSAAALARAPFTDATRALISANSAKAELYEVSLLDGSMVPITLRTLPTVADFIQCGEKTVRIALKANGIVKRK